MRVLTPATVAEAAGMRSAEPGAVLAAGTTDLLPAWHAGAPRPECLILLGGVEEMRNIEIVNDAFEIGALASHADVADHEGIGEHLPALAAAARSIGAPAVRNMGTIGGNVANASPAADLPPPLLAYGASVHLASASGDRTVPLEEFFLGYRKTDMREGELIRSFTVPLPPAGAVSRFEKLGTRRAQSIAKLSLAGCATCTDTVESIRLATGSMAEIPRRLVEVEAVLEGRRLDGRLVEEAVRAASEALVPIDDVRSTAAYRGHALGVLITRFLGHIMEICT
jgi:CO/xanthine dehydrogenase FAD-binding subunit